MNEKQIIAGHMSAIELSSDCAGEYLTEIKKTDLAKLSDTEWYMLLDIIIKNYTAKVYEFPPF